VTFRSEVCPPAGLQLHYSSILLGSFKEPVSGWVILYTTCVNLSTRILREILLYMTSCDLQRCRILRYSYRFIPYRGLPRAGSNLHPCPGNKPLSLQCLTVWLYTSTMYRKWTSL